MALVPRVGGGDELSATCNVRQAIHSGWRRYRVWMEDKKGRGVREIYDGLALTLEVTDLVVGNTYGFKA